MNIPGILPRYDSAMTPVARQDAVTTQRNFAASLLRVQDKPAQRPPAADVVDTIRQMVREERTNQDRRIDNTQLSTQQEDVLLRKKPAPLNPQRGEINLTV
jgi:hypothetical protein